MSGKPGLNQRPITPKAIILPTELFPDRLYYRLLKYDFDFERDANAPSKSWTYNLFFFREML